jgi:hypothetical protein
MSNALSPTTAGTPQVSSAVQLRQQRPRRGLNSYSEETPTAPCQHDMWCWDLDRGTYPDWVRARAECRSCPLLGQCRTQLAQLYPDTGKRDQGPQGVIWAGDAYGNHGTILSDSQLRTLAQRRAGADAA